MLRIRPSTTPGNHTATVTVSILLSGGEAACFGKGSHCLAQAVSNSLCSNIYHLHHTIDTLLFSVFFPETNLWKPFSFCLLLLSYIRNQKEKVIDRILNQFRFYMSQWSNCLVGEGGSKCVCVKQSSIYFRLAMSRATDPLVSLGRIKRHVSSHPVYKVVRIKPRASYTAGKHPTELHP